MYKNAMFSRIISATKVPCVPARVPGVPELRHQAGAPGAGVGEELQVQVVRGRLHSQGRGETDKIVAEERPHCININLIDLKVEIIFYYLKITWLSADVSLKNQRSFPGTGST